MAVEVATLLAEAVAGTLVLWLLLMAVLLLVMLLLGYDILNAMAKGK